MEKSFEFVVKHYRSGAFKPSTVFVRVGRWRPWTIAASIAGAVLVAAAMVYTTVITPQSSEPTATEQVEQVTAEPEVVVNTQAVKRIDFEDAPLSDVVKAIESTYGVKVTGLSPDDTNRLTLSYEGNAADLVETINELSGTNLRVVNTNDEAK